MRCAIWALALWLAVGSVWQPARIMTAAGRRNLIVRSGLKIGIFQDRLLLNYVLCAMVDRALRARSRGMAAALIRRSESGFHAFFLHPPAVSVKSCMLELKAYAAGLRDLDKIL